MKILYISQYFPPEKAAPAVRVYELAKHWIEMGHQVKVLTAFPNHPTGVIPEEYRGDVLRREIIDGIEVIRTWVFAAPNKGFTKRIINYLSFPISASILGTSMVKDCDIMIATSPQFFVAGAGYIISKFKRRPFVFEVRDLWPDSIVAVGALKNKFALNLLSEMECFFYKRASGIVGVAESVREVISKRAGKNSKIAIIPNGVNVDFFSSNSVDKSDNDDEFVVSYIGTHGMSQGLEVVLDAADKLRDYNIKFLFVGEGAEKDNLIKYAQQRELSSVTFLPAQSHELIPEFYRSSDICLVPLKDREVFSLTIPSKIFEIMACGRPIILGVKGESRNIIERAKAGIPVEPENPEALADAILTLYNDREQCEIMGMSGRDFVERFYSRKKFSQEYIKFLSYICNSNGKNSRKP
jgi:glycosyltransferase involved in cell wall biosynthesis